MTVRFGDKRLPDRFWQKVEPEPMSGCWLWSAGLNGRGYAQFSQGNWPYAAHRVAYLTLVGPTPERTELDHLCRVKSCVNPSHLEPVSHRENMLRGDCPSAWHAKKTHCDLGHPLNGVRSAGHGRKSRCCTVCLAEKSRVWQARHRERNPEHYRALARERARRYYQRKKEAGL